MIEPWHALANGKFRVRLDESTQKRWLEIALSCSKTVRSTMTAAGLSTFVRSSDCLT